MAALIRTAPIWVGTVKDPAYTEKGQAYPGQPQVRVITVVTAILLIRVAAPLTTPRAVLVWSLPLMREKAADSALATLLPMMLRQDLASHAVVGGTTKDEPSETYRGALRDPSQPAARRRDQPGRYWR
ncbi:MAG: hypothetical protein M1553_13085 [Firmicutes bacterium]|nr:hypothetical protein [Bacillota bacterium]